MSVPSQTTIVALATPVGISGIAVIRVSGPLALNIACKLSGLSQDRFRDRYAVFCPVHHPDGREIDQGVLTFYRGPRSYTGEDVLEISTHGGTVIPNTIMEACFRLGCEPAGPGDFTRRAFLNGKLDLSQAEAVADVISAKTGVSHQVSYRILSGNFSALIHQMKADLLRVVSVVEAELDFSTHEIEPMPPDTKRQMIDTVLHSARGLLNTYSTGRLLRDGATVSIIGRPNVGKSSLLNAIISEERVIVTDHPGTTRDAVEVYYQLDGVPVSLIDTAGLGSSDDPIEQRGIQFSQEFITKSDLVLWVFDITEPPSDILEDVSNPFFDAPFLVVLNKADLLTDSIPEDALAHGNESPPIVVSALKKTGVHVLARRLVNTLVSSDLTDQEVLLTNARHKKALEDSVRSLKKAQQLVVSNGEDELVAFQIRDGLSHLDRILGITTADDILDNIFSTFCVGK